MGNRSRKFWLSGVLITLAIVSVSVLSRYWEVGLMGIHAASENYARQKAFQKEVCGNQEQHQAQIKALTDSRVWSFRQHSENRLPNARVEVGVSGQFLTDIYGSDGSDTAAIQLRALYWYEYCRDNNPFLDVYDQQFTSLAAVYRGGTRRRGVDREWDDYVYDCRSLARVGRIIEELIELGFWEKVEPSEDEWRGNKYLAIHVLPKFRPQDFSEGALSPEERGDREATRHRYYSAAALWGVCTGHHYKLRIAAPKGKLGGEIVASPYVIKRDLERIKGMPDW